MTKKYHSMVYATKFAFAESPYFVSLYRLFKTIIYTFNDWGFMKKHILLFVIMFTALKGFSQTNVSGSLSQNTTWTKAGSPYVLAGNVGVRTGITLTVEAGVQIERYAQNQILVNGALQMNGTETDSITLFTNYNSTLDDKGFIEFAKSNLDSSSLRYLTFRTAGSGAGNIRVGTETQAVQTSPKNSGTLYISHCNLSNGATTASGYNAALGVFIDSSYMDAGWLRNDGNDATEPVAISNSAFTNSRLYTGNGSYTGTGDNNHMNYFNCTFENSGIGSGEGDSVNMFFDSCRLTNSSVGTVAGGGISFLRSVNVNSAFSGIGHVKISKSTFTLTSDADLSNFRFFDKSVFVNGGTISCDSSTFSGISPVICFHMQDYVNNPYGDTVVHNSFTGFKGNVEVGSYNSYGIVVDYNIFSPNTSSTLYDIINLSTQDFYAYHNFFDLSSNKTIDDYIYDNNDDLSVGFVYYDSSSTGALPVKLVSFSAFYENRMATLQWKTSNEINVSSFVVQHLENGVYTDASIVAAKGGAGNSYALATARVNEGMNMYRLKMIEKDGMVSYSKSVSITAAITAAIAVYPNPASRYVMVTHPTDSKVSQIQLADMNGAVIKTIVVAKGDVQNRMSLDGIAKGTYRVIWRASSSTVSRAIIIE